MVVAMCAVGCSLLLVAAIVVGAAGLVVAGAVVVVVTHRMEGARAIACRTTVWASSKSSSKRQLMCNTLCVSAEETTSTSSNK
jgi:ABC-type uncharacterized transport system ATPase subunit